MKVKLILPALTEAESPFWRPIKYSLFPPIGLATLAGHLSENDEIDLQDQHIEQLNLDDTPDLVVIQVYITNAYRAYQIADYYRSKGVFVILGGLHVTSVPEEAMAHADAIFVGPADESFPRFLKDFRTGKAQKIYKSNIRTLDNLPLVRRDLIKREKYFVPNSLVVSRGCPHNCKFCYKESFYEGGKSFYTETVDRALAEIERLPGRHLYFLDDHLLADPKFAKELFQGMLGMKRVFQGAATIDSILRGDLVEKAVEAGLRSLFVGFETFSPENLKQSNKKQNLEKNYIQAVEKLKSLGVKINGSFVFGLDYDDKDVFKRTVEWGIKHSITTATFHILTPYPGTALFEDMQLANRMVTRNWDLYDTRNVVYKPQSMTAEELKQGYDWAYKEFYSWSNIYQASINNPDLNLQLKHFLYTAGWKKFEPAWNFIIKSGKLKKMLPLLESILSK